MFLLALSSCKKVKEEDPGKSKLVNEVQIQYATGFSILEYQDYYTLNVNSPWPKADITYTYVLVKENKSAPKGLKADAILQLPIQKIITTSTTHIPSLETLGVIDRLMGFPQLDYISSPLTRSFIEDKKIKEVGRNESLNTEVILDLNPDALIAFSVDGTNQSFKTLNQAKIPVLFNGDWVEEHPLGKAEWIKFFGVLFGKLSLAQKTFKTVEKNYLEIQEKVAQKEDRPTVLSGALYKDVWYAPGGKSWQAKLIADAGGNYIFSETNASGSLSLGIEAVIEKAYSTDVWVGPGQHNSYNQMLTSSDHYKKFKSFEERNVYSFTVENGATGGVLYYELAPNRPDLVLKDLAKIFHPAQFKAYNFTFFKPLKNE
ncbi:ABC transporter substrate-binding protein [Gangjinia marincola]|uniref:ABC transporter substrate-binding protein n=1 Tax=Gangjinia marincola TaxID=578463 RepID=A0ABN1MFS6_9FLAO